MKVIVATPMYNAMCTAGYTSSMINLFKYASTINDVEIDFMYGINEALITYARNICANMFLKSDADYLLFIDADIQFDPEQVVRMIRTQRDLVCGIYPKKKIDWVKVKHASQQNVPVEVLPSYANEYLFEPVDPNFKEEVDGTVEIRRAGTGMMLIGRRVFEELADKVDRFSLVSPVTSNVKFDQQEKYIEYFYTSKDPETNIFYNEDFTFCNLWRNNGGKIYGAPWVKLFHTGNHTFG